jgi:hypothetical protein
MDIVTATCMNCTKHIIVFTAIQPKKCPGCGHYNLPCMVCNVEECDMSTYEKVCPHTKKK